MNLFWVPVGAALVAGTLLAVRAVAATHGRAAASGSGTNPHRLSLSLVLLFLGAAGVLYLVDAPGPHGPELAGNVRSIPRPAMPGGEPAASGSVASVATLAKRLAQRLEEQPDDGPGWLLLGRSYEHLGRREKARAAYARAAALGESVPEMRDAGDVPAARAATQPSENGQPVDVLKARVANTPDDWDSWVSLARAHQAEGRYADAARAFGKATALRPGDAQLWADYADTLAAANGRRLIGRPTELVQKALALDPDHPKALWLAGTAALQRGDKDAAARHWRHLRELLPPDSADAKVLEANLTELAHDAPSSTKGPDGVRITGEVRLADALASEVNPDATLFVVARAVDGPRAPLAVLRAQARQLPYRFVLDDSLAMVPQLKLSAFSRVAVKARISRSGIALPQSGDLTGEAVQVDPADAAPVHLIIDRPVP